MLAAEPLSSLPGSVPLQRQRPQWKTGKAEAETHWGAWGPAGPALGSVLPQVVLSQLILIKLGKFVCHSSTETGGQGYQLVLISSSQALSGRAQASDRNIIISKTQTGPSNPTRPFLGSQNSTAKRADFSPP